MSLQLQDIVYLLTEEYFNTFVLYLLRRNKYYLNNNNEIEEGKYIYTDTRRKDQNGNYRRERSVSTEQILCCTVKVLDSTTLQRYSRWWRYGYLLFRIHEIYDCSLKRRKKTKQRSEEMKNIIYTDFELRKLISIYQTILDNNNPSGKITIR